MGRGSRRLYDIMDLSRMAIARHLVDAGFSPEAVGKAVRVIPDSKLRSWQHVIETKGNRAAQMDLLVWERGEWQLMKVAAVQEAFQSRFEHFSPTNLSGLFILNFHRSIAALDLAIEDAARSQGE
jgi:DNA-binding transcriptional MerR regulator